MGERGKAIVLDFSRKPLVIAEFRDVPGDDEFVDYLNALERNLHDSIKRGVKTALILDTTPCPTPVSAKQRRMQTEWLAEHDAALRAGCVGTAFVIQSSLVRGAMTAVLWMQKMPYDYTVVATRQQAETWCLDLLNEAGVQVSSAVE